MNQQGSIVTPYNYGPKNNQKLKPQLKKSSIKLRFLSLDAYSRKRIPQLYLMCWAASLWEPLHLKFVPQNGQRE